MPVSTRSKVFGGQDESNSTRQTRVQKGEESQSQMGAPLLRNPHQGLKEKMKALTLLYEQHQQMAATRNVSQRFSSHPSVELLGSSRKKEREKKQECPVKDGENRNLNQLPMAKPGILTGEAVEAEDAKEKENLGAFHHHMVSFSCPKKDTSSKVVRKLSMGALPPPLSEVLRPRRDSKAGGDLDAISENAELGGSRILVFVRLRPMAKKEKEMGARCCVRIVNRRDIYLTEFATENDYLRLKRVRGRHFAFDASFPDSTSQQEVYTATTANLVEAVLQGRNGSVFCYGATGAGKTYTMLGTVENPGVMVLAIKDLFAKIRQRSCDGNHVVHLSYLEVYNETVRDLLSPGRPLVLREDKQGIVAAGLTQYRAYSTDEVMSLLQQGNQNRTTEPTRVNETSSRSHAILQVIAEYRVKEGSNVIHRVGKLSLIDLAGSERALATDQRTLRSLEGANINRSLLALSSCINALVEGKKHIPYRNSKLTQLLKDSLGGSCNTVMIANISPSNLSLGETQNTLHWADRAKEIRTKACPVNEEQVPESETEKTKVLIELQKENHELRMQLARQQQKLLTIQAQNLAPNPSASPSISSVISSPQSAQPSEKRRPKSSILAGNCFSTPDAKKRGTEQTVKELRLTVKILEAELDRLKKDHILQIKQKDDIINELLMKNAKPTEKGEVVRVVTRASMRKQEPVERCRVGGQKASAAGELKSPSHRFVSPVPAPKKRSFWDITTANSPSVTNLNGRKTRSHVMGQAPSMLLQPGFARQRP